MSHNTWDYAAYLRDRGYRMTPQRQMIMDAICEAQGHTTLPEIWARVQRKSSAINQATLYRALHFLVETGLIVKAELAPGEMVYEIAGPSRHHHLLCRACHHEIEVDAAPFDELHTALQARYGFAVDTNHLLLTGLCAYCQENVSDADDEAQRCYTAALAEP